MRPTSSHPGTQKWPITPVQRATIRWNVWGLLIVALALLTIAVSFLVMPQDVETRHYVCAALVAVKGFALMVIWFRQFTTVIRGKGRRRAS